MSISSLSQQVYDALYERLLTSQLRPGDEINRRAVAKDLGVSLSPVLEAMTQLEWEGFLETRARRGTLVRRVTARQVLGRMHLRIAIETQAARIYAGPQIAAARDRMLALAAANDATQPGTRGSFDHEVTFHRALVALSDSPGLTDTFDHVMRHSIYHTAVRLLPMCPTRHSAKHVKLVKGLLAASPEQADTLIRAHLNPWLELLTQAADAEAEAGPVAALPRRGGSPRA
jgi:DNA-binding GntR family transcriptional regulator